MNKRIALINKLLAIAGTGVLLLACCNFSHLSGYGGFATDKHRVFRMVSHSDTREKIQDPDEPAVNNWLKGFDYRKIYTNSID